MEAGRLAEAEAACQDILAADPGNVDALRVLGDVAYRAGNHAAALGLIQRAIAGGADDAAVHGLHCLVLRAMGRHDDAIAAGQRAVRQQPEVAEAHFHLGNALRGAGRIDEAIFSLRLAASLKPDEAAIHNGLGIALLEAGQPEEAGAAFRLAADLQPDFAAAHNNLGNALQKLGRSEAAAACYRRAIALEPGLAGAHCNLGNLLKDSGALDEAIACYRQAISLAPGFAAGHASLGEALLDKSDLDEAAACLQKALALAPGHAAWHMSLGNLCKDAAQLDAAIAQYRRASELTPGDPGPASNLVFALQFHPAYDPAAMREEQRRWNRRFAEPARQHRRPHGNDRDPERRLRIGYVSPNFTNHCQSFFTVPVLAHHDHSSFEVHCYADVRRPAPITGLIRSYADAWHWTAGISDAELDDLIRHDRIDILVDLSMHMGGNRLTLFARKPAPVQVTWLAYPGTTGLDDIDYRLSDPHLDPPGCDMSYYAEQTIRLPDSFWCYDPLAAASACEALPAVAVGHLTFGSLNNYCKVNDAVLKLWSQALRAVNGSRLLLLSKSGGHRRYAMDLFLSEGISADRIGWLDPMPREDYLAAYNSIDVVLDTFPYNGHTTSLDSFWMGVPVVTLVGDTIVGRAGLCMATNLALPQLVAHSPAQFVEIVVGLAEDLPALARLRQTLRSRMQASPLMDACRFTRNLEAAYRQMWRTWCGQPGSAGN